MIKDIHVRTFEILGPKGESLLASYRHATGHLEPSLFAPYLRQKLIEEKTLPHSLVDLATLEWAVHFASSMRGVAISRLPSNSLRLNPTLTFIQTQTPILDVYKSDVSNFDSLKELKAEPQMYAIFLTKDREDVNIIEVKESWAPLLDMLREGAVLLSEIRGLLAKNFQLLMSESTCSKLIEELSALQIVEK